MSDLLSHPDPEADAAAHRLITRIAALSTPHDALHAGRRVRWRRFGSDDTQPPLVLLHGGHGSWMHWLRNVEALSAARTLWLPDMPGFNDSDTPPPPSGGQTALDPSLDALAATLDSLVGAGTPGSTWAASPSAGWWPRSSRCGAAACAGWRCWAARATAPSAAWRSEMINWRAAKDREEERAALLHNLGALMLHDPAAIDALAFAIHDASCHGTRFRSKDVSMAGGLQAALDAFAGPTLLLWGEHDVTADARPLVAQLAAGHPRREGVVVDGAGHWVQYERADEVKRAARALLLLKPSPRT